MTPPPQDAPGFEGHAAAVHTPEDLTQLEDLLPVSPEKVGRGNSFSAA